MCICYILFLKMNNVETFDLEIEIFELERKRFIDADYADFKDFMF